jgi:hypothetical protein
VGAAGMIAAIIEIGAEMAEYPITFLASTLKE